MLLWGGLLVFYSLCALLDVLGAFKHVNRKFLSGILLLPLAILVAFRAEYVGPDTHNYIRNYAVFAKYQSLGDALKNAKMEDGFVFFGYLCSKVGISYQGFQVLISSFIFYSFYRFVHKYSPYIAVSCFLIYANFYVFGSMNVVRMWMAVTVLLFAVESFTKNQLKKFIIIVLLASLFHVSALCFLVAYPLQKVHWSLGKTSSIFLCATGISVFAYPICKILFSIIGKYENYLSRFGNSNLLTAFLDLLIEFLFFAFLTLVCKKHITKDTSESKLIQLLYTLQIISVCVSVVGFSNNIMGRVAYYFTAFSAVGIPMGISKIKISSSRLIFSTVLILCLCAKFFVILGLRPEWYCVVPYGFFV